MKYYTGIGSRQTPQKINELFTKLALNLEKLEYILRSGGSDGADSAFERGVIKNKNKEIYLPCKLYNNNSSSFYKISLEASELASKFHPKYSLLSFFVKKLMARSCYQVLGLSLDKPSKFVICWTPNGDMIGGTSQALRIALFYNIPIINFGCAEDFKVLIQNIKNLL